MYNTVTIQNETYAMRPICEGKGFTLERVLVVDPEKLGLSKMTASELMELFVTEEVSMEVSSSCDIYMPLQPIETKKGAILPLRPTKTYLLSCLRKHKGSHITVHGLNQGPLKLHKGERMLVRVSEDGTFNGTIL